MKALAVILTFFFVMGVQAEEADKKFDNVHQLSKRPYSQVPAKVEKFEGDVEAAEEASDKKYKLLNLHQLGRRPYAEKNTD